MESEAGHLSFLPELVQVSNLPDPLLLHLQIKTRFSVCSTSCEDSLDKPCAVLSHTVCNTVKVKHVHPNHFVHQPTALPMCSSWSWTRHCSVNSYFLCFYESQGCLSLFLRRNTFHTESVAKCRQITEPAVAAVHPCNPSTQRQMPAQATLEYQANYMANPHSKSQNMGHER